MAAGIDGLAVALQQALALAPGGCGGQMRSLIGVGRHGGGGGWEGALLTLGFGYRSLPKHHKQR